MFLAFCLLAKLNFDLPTHNLVLPDLGRLLRLLPAHFYFLSPDPGLFYSRALYFGSIGIAILIAVLLGQTFGNPRMCLGWAVAGESAPARWNSTQCPGLAFCLAGVTQDTSGFRPTFSPPRP